MFCLDLNRLKSKFVETPQKVNMHPRICLEQGFLFNYGDFSSLFFSGLAQISGKVRVSKAATGNTWIERIIFT